MSMNGATSAVLTPTSTEMSWDGKIDPGLVLWWDGSGGEGMREYLTLQSTVLTHMLQRVCTMQNAAIRA